MSNQENNNMTAVVISDFHVRDHAWFVLIGARVFNAHRLRSCDSRYFELAVMYWLVLEF